MKCQGEGRKRKKILGTSDYESHETYVSLPGYESVAGTVNPRVLSGIDDKKQLKITPEESYKSSGNDKTAFPSFEDDVKDRKQFLKIDNKSAKYTTKNVSGINSGRLIKSYLTINR